MQLRNFPVMLTDTLFFNHKMNYVLDSHILKGVCGVMYIYTKGQRDLHL